MATALYQGGTTAVAQIETFALQNDFNNSETALTMTVTAEDGSTTQTVAIDPSGTDESTIAAAWQTALDASNQTLFTPITWTVSTATVTGTAKVAGRPFFAASSVTGGAGSVTDSISTANAGPHAYGTAANHTDAVPTTGDDIFAAPHPTDDISYDIKYDLAQSAVSLNELRFPDTYSGSVGDNANGYYLHTDVDNGGNTILILNGRGEFYWLKGTIPNVHVLRAIPSKDAVHLDGDVDDLYITGPNVQGTITLANSMTIDNIRILNSPGAIVKLGTSLSSLDLIEMDSGNVLLESQPAASAIFNVNGGILTIETATWTNASIVINIRAPGIVRFNSGGTLPILNLFGGEYNLDGNQSTDLTMTTTSQYGGFISANSGLSNLTWSTANRFGGNSSGNVVITDVVS